LHIATTSFILQQKMQQPVIIIINQGQKLRRCILQQFALQQRMHNYLNLIDKKYIRKWHAKCITEGAGNVF
jgi:intergrase/recombinase